MTGNTIKQRRRRPRGCQPLTRRSWSSLILSYWDDCSSPLSSSSRMAAAAASRDIRTLKSGGGDLAIDVAIRLDKRLGHFIDSPFSKNRNAGKSSNAFLASEMPINRPSSRDKEQRKREKECSSPINNSHHKDVAKAEDPIAIVTNSTAAPAINGSCESTTTTLATDSNSAIAASCKEISKAASFTSLRINYLVVTVAIMLADGLQGTHLYVLYEGYGVSVASLYSLGFLTGALTSLVTGPLVDKFGRKKSAVLYCFLEIGINLLEQYPLLAGLIASRMVSGVTNNLLSSVFESWLDTEYRRLGLDEDKFEIIMRDSVVLSNLAAIGSGYLSHVLAERYGPVGPFQGAVTFTAVALVVVMGVWAENFGSHQNAVKTTICYLNDAYSTFKSDSRILRVGIIQGLTMGAVQIFVFLWSPALRQFASNTDPSTTTMGLDSHGNPAYGLIFGAFMFSGVLGGLIAPMARKAVTMMLSPLARKRLEAVEVPGVGKVRPMAVEFLAAFCYMACAVLLLTPCVVSNEGSRSFSLSLVAFLVYEFMVGLYLPCEGVIRSLYIPADARATMMTLPRIIVNIAVAVGVASTNFVSRKTAFASISFLMLVAAVLQISLVSAREWSCLLGRVNQLQERVVRSFSYLPDDDSKTLASQRRVASDSCISRSKKDE